MGEILKLLDGNLIVAQIICFGLLMFLLKKFLWGPTLAMLDERKEKVASDLQVIEDAKAEVQVLKLDYERHISKIADEAQERYKIAMHEAEGKARDVQIKAHHEADKIVEDARKEIRFELTQARQALKDDIVEMVVKVTEQMIQEKLSFEDDLKIVEDMVQGLNEVKLHEN